MKTSFKGTVMVLCGTVLAAACSCSRSDSSASAVVLTDHGMSERYAAIFERFRDRSRRAEVSVEVERFLLVFSADNVKPSAARNPFAIMDWGLIELLGEPDSVDKATGRWGYMISDEKGRIISTMTLEIRDRCLCSVGVGGPPVR